MTRRPVHAFPLWRINNSIANLNEALGVTFDLGQQPDGARFRSNHRKQSTRLDDTSFAGLCIFEFYCFKGLAAHHFSNFGESENFNVWVGFHATRQITRHAACKTFATYHEHDFLCVVGEKHCRLPSGIAGTDDNYGRALAELGLARGRGVVNAKSFEILPSLRFQSMILSARSDDYALRAQHRVTSFNLQFRPIVSLRKAKGQCLRGCGKLCAKTKCLKLRVISQVPDADAFMKAAKVFDQRIRPR